MSTPISNLFPNAPSAAANVATNTAPAPQPRRAAAADTVQLTEAQQVFQLFNQGQSVSQIASSLSLSVPAVNTYLNIAGSSG
jgi:DNA-binding CsgD family transcriptional regulator